MIEHLYQLLNEEVEHNFLLSFAIFLIVFIISIIVVTTLCIITN